MADTEQVAFRLPRTLLERVDDFVAKMEKEQAGMRITRTDAIRVLLVRALDADAAHGGLKRRRKASG